VLVRMWGKSNTVPCWWECKLVWQLWKKFGCFLKI
jgi:hypothetical protein